MMQMLVAQETLHLYHHLKEIMVAVVLPLVLAVEAVVVVPEIPEQMVLVVLTPQKLVVPEVTEQRLQFLAHL
jgi:hypothetical protein